MANGHQVETRNTAHFLHDYDSEQPDLRRLYEQAKNDQWNAARDIAWSVPLDGDGGLIADDLVDLHGTRFWDGMSEARPDRAQPQGHALAALDPDAGRARRHAAVQPARELRRGPGRQALPGDTGRRRGAAQRGAAALSRPPARRRDLSARRQREGDLRHAARHLVVVPQDDRPAARRRDLRRLAVPDAGRVRPRTRCCARSAGASCRTRRATWASPCCRCRRWSRRRPRPSTARWRISPSGRSSRTLAGIFPLAAYQEIGIGKAEIDEIKQFRRERAAGGDETAFRKYFRRDLHDGLVRNLRKVGLITDRIAPNLQSFGSSSQRRN